ncbi:glucosamine inositolphosphorylceramide transferase family protein [Acidaminobacter hydrogenoformans]|uniref:Glucosamine inositolphosphorylceramide transferase 1 N-terminal domain-containing protein n=1 Tax=Acidaminobacter hydrogenoformans DSM 2784 TaxID=1120920 RepID=A0A1G5RQD4_9FIRM|nr:hypothetical protein [Acidaminobacter hydrogenoformans]SCZ76078.1 hypothetical protein SAMN03080599_00056 [Acidaminobacter hydrogenoformans DSM 2784]
MNLRNMALKVKVSEWAIAYRRKTEGAPWDFNTPPYTVLGNAFRYWCADPFVVEEGGRTFVFFEAFDRYKRKGLLGCREIFGDGIGEIRIVIEESHHLSYPCVFKENENWYLIPETKDANEIARYRAVDFPYQWEKEKVILNQIAVVDNTVYSITAGNLTLLTYIWQIFNRGELMILNLTEASNKIIARIDDPNGRKRPAGNLFKLNGVWFRPSQLNTRVYGEAIIFNEILKFTEDAYEEKEYKVIGVKDLKLDKNVRVTGVHTYNRSENWEVIDVEINGFSINRTLEMLPRLYSVIKKTLRSRH